MAPCDLGHEGGFRATHVLDRLPWNRLWQEANEVAGMSGSQPIADLALLLHAADAWSVPSTRVEDDNRRLGGVEHDTGRRNHSREHVVDRPLQRPAVAHQLNLKREHVWCNFGTVFEMSIAPLTQGIERQDEALPGVGYVFAERAHYHQRVRHRGERERSAY